MRNFLSSGKVAGILSIIFVGIFLIFLFKVIVSENSDVLSVIPGVETSLTPSENIFRSFYSAEEMRQYIERWDSRLYVDGFGMGGMNRAVNDTMPRVEESLDFQADAPSKTGVRSDRVSGTNVQVIGIDEPDIVKTNGRELYISQEESRYFITPSTLPIFLEDDVMPEDFPVIDAPEYKESSIIAARAFPVDTMDTLGEIEDRSGNMLLYEDTLIIFGNTAISGYDVSNPKSPEEIWVMQIKEGGNVVDARLKDGEVYLITQSRMDVQNPCPIEPLMKDGEPIRVACEDILYPRYPTASEVLYTVSRLKAKTGEVRESQTMLGTNDMTLAFFEDGLYLGYTQYASALDVMSDFFRENTHLVSQDVFSQIEKIREYDISEQSKLNEFQRILDRHSASLASDERLKFQNELTNASAKYLEQRKRDLVVTHLVKMNLKSLEIDEVGSVPGTLLNQFSIDAYEGYVRTATTVGANVWQFGNQVEETNDLYILDGDLDIVGSVTDFGDDERIYSVRFLGDKGYVVTFKQIDPFFVFDLSNPKNPEKKGELKIPGYSSYLHPLKEDVILGIGKEESKVKASLFDVSNPERPKELDTYILDEYWSDILNTHHAFLQDARHEIFFLPGSKGGYIFSYKGDAFEMVKAVSNVGARRAVYIDDYLYVIGSSAIVVIDENTWKTVNRLVPN